MRCISNPNITWTITAETFSAADTYISTSVISQCPASSAPHTPFTYIQYTITFNIDLNHIGDTYLALQLLYT